VPVPQPKAGSESSGTLSGEKPDAGLSPRVTILVVLFALAAFAAGFWTDHNRHQGDQAVAPRVGQDAEPSTDPAKAFWPRSSKRIPPPSLLMQMQSSFWMDRPTSSGTAMERVTTVARGSIRTLHASLRPIRRWWQRRARFILTMDTPEQATLRQWPC
jgi:hypothetical protein